MPELPEVEVTRRGLAPHIECQIVSGVVLRRNGLRWPFPANLDGLLRGQTIHATGRRGKYLLIHFAHGCLMVHLGMSGRLRMLPSAVPAGRHDHFDLLVGERAMRMTDPRRFGAVLWHDHQDGAIESHPRLARLGIEPFDKGFSGALLYQKSRKLTADIKQTLLSGRIVVGVGNIYASECLFRAGIHPGTPSGRIGLARYERLADAIREVLGAAIELGGSSLRDYSDAEGQSGYFQLHALVYDRAGMPCVRCNTPLRHVRQGQRSTFFCARCQR